MCDAHRYGFETARAYADARRAELMEALQTGQIHSPELLQLEVPDQETPFHLPNVARWICRRILEHRPEVILTHPYEGGHPDHDACAFSVRAACRMSDFSGQLCEFTSYHASENGFRSGEFLPAKGSAVVTYHLTEEERERKHKMFRCFHTQREVLRQFEIDHESFRAAPDYDFYLPPHGGPLYYERFGWRVDGKQFCELAKGASRELGFSV